MNETPIANRLHIAFLGRRNTGKSSLVNAFTGQNISIVSDVKGTTTDPVYKAMELPPLGPVVIIDTPGIDDEGDLGELHIQKTQQVLRKTDVAIVVVENEAHQSEIEKTSHGGTKAQRHREEEIIEILEARKIPYIIVMNKCDIDPTLLTSQKSPCIARMSKNNQNHGGLQHKLLGGTRSFIRLKYLISVKLQATLVALLRGKSNLLDSLNASAPPCENISDSFLPVSAKTGYNINLLKEKIAALAQSKTPEKPLVADLLKPLDFVVLVIPIDSAAPKGRLILPQQQVIRGILDAGGIAIAVKDSELCGTLDSLGKKPALVITDSQVFEQVAAIVPQEIALTSFSILFARYKGFLETAVKGASALDTLQDGDKILISEGCTHHRQCDDIGTVKIPRMIRKFSSKEPEFVFSSGGDFPEDLSPYKLVIHCGACMLNDREMHYRRRLAEEQNIPFTNYGIAIAHIQGILKRSVSHIFHR
ncbi:MAG: [FeFe] hydrogenase H-cluster maturation GTPase HydF [Treponema sp.]|jgi:[FeFe] hydrogenase H-cluster maturation GTPase HydF|nr:[FeFe] hydrogenase H-cluster maturation GTPase HydF [Treponema sp.]